MTKPTLYVVQEMDDSGMVTRTRPASPSEIAAALDIDYEAMREVLAIPDESGAFFSWHSVDQLQDAVAAALGKETT